MARNPQEIFDELVSIKEADSNADELTSTSVTALWRVYLYVVAVGISIFEQVQDTFLLDLQYQKDTTIVYTAPWWNDRMINQFQYAPGDSDRGVIAINDQFQIGYVIEDDTKKIIEFSATKQADRNRQVTIKVAKDDGLGNPEQLTTDEQQAAATYVDRVKGAGLLISVVSFPSDILTLDFDLYYDGQFVESVVEDNVNTAIITYLQNLPFDGTIKLINLIDSIQEVEGVKDVLINVAQAQPEGGEFVTFNRVYDTKAGYASYDITSSIINMIIE